MKKTQTNAPAYVPYPIEPVKPTGTKLEKMEIKDGVNNYSNVAIPEGATHITAKEHGCDMYGYEIEVTFWKSVTISEADLAKQTKEYEKELIKYKKKLVAYQAYQEEIQKQQKKNQEDIEKQTYLRLKKKYDKTGS